MLDNLIILVYLIILLIASIYNRGNSNYQEYTSLGKLKNHKLVLMATIFASAVGGGTTFGLTESVYTNNLSYVYALVLTAPLDILVALYLGPKLSKYYGCSTVGDIVNNYYGKVGTIIAGLSVIISSIGYMAAQISVSSKIYQHLFSLNSFYAILLSYMLLIIYTSIGGFRSVVFANVIQFVTMIIAIPILTFLGMYQIGIDGFLTNLPSQKYDLSNQVLLSEVVVAALCFLVMGLYPTLIQRMISSDNPKKVTHAIVGKTIIYVLFITCIGINGLLCYAFSDQINSDQNLLIGLIDILIPQGLKGIVFIGFLAATMSTADADLNFAGITFVKDVLSKLVPIKNQKTMLIITQFFTILGGILAIYLALKFENVIDLVIFAAGFWAPIMLVPFIAALYNIRITTNQFIFCSLTSLGITILNELHAQPIYNLKSVFIGSVTNLICFACCLVVNHFLRKSS